MLKEVIQSRRSGWAYRTALSVRETFSVHDTPTDDDLQRVLDGLGIELVEENSLPYGLSEIMSDGTLVVSNDASRVARRWAIAHAIGHHLGHGGDQTKLAPEWRWRQERQADVFAGWLLIGTICLGQARSFYDLAELAEIPVERVAVWVGWLAA